MIIELTSNEHYFFLIRELIQSEEVQRLALETPEIDGRELKSEDQQ